MQPENESLPLTSTASSSSGGAAVGELVASGAPAGAPVVTGALVVVEIGSDGAVVVAFVGAPDDGAIVGERV